MNSCDNFRLVQYINVGYLHIVRTGLDGLDIVNLLLFVR